MLGDGTLKILPSQPLVDGDQVLVVLLALVGRVGQVEDTLVGQELGDGHGRDGLVLLLPHVVDDEKLAQVAHLLQRVVAVAVAVQSRHELVEEAGGCIVVLEQERLMAKGVEDVVLRQVPIVAFVNLETLAIRSRRMLFLTALGKSITRQDDVKRILPHQGRGRQQVAVGGLLQQQSAPQVLGFICYPYIGQCRFLEPNKIK